MTKEFAAILPQVITGIFTVVGGSVVAWWSRHGNDLAYRRQRRDERRKAYVDVLAMINLAFIASKLPNVAIDHDRTALVGAVLALEGPPELWNYFVPFMPVLERMTAGGPAEADAKRQELEAMLPELVRRMKAALAAV